MGPRLGGDFAGRTGMQLLSLAEGKRLAGEPCAAVRFDADSVLGHRRAGDVLADAFELLAPMSGHPGVGVQGKSIGVCAQGFVALVGIALALGRPQPFR